MRRNMIRDDSWLLIDAVTKAAVSAGRHVLDLCTGSGVVWDCRGQQGAASVTGLDIGPPRCALLPHPLVGVDVDLRLGALPHALSAGPLTSLSAIRPICRWAGTPVLR